MPTMTTFPLFIASPASCPTVIFGSLLLVGRGFLLKYQNYYLGLNNTNASLSLLHQTRSPSPCDLSSQFKAF